MTKLVIPENPADIGRCSHLAWMRVTVNDEPATAMLVGKKNVYVLCVSKTGEVSQFPLHQKRVSFVDYLLETDSVTMFGSAETLHQIDETVPPFWSMQPRPNTVADIPDYTPFLSVYETCKDTPWPSMWIRYDDRFRLISFDETNRYGKDFQGFGGECFDSFDVDGSNNGRRTRSQVEKMYGFVGWLDPEIWMPRFEKHNLFVKP